MLKEQLRVSGDVGWGWGVGLMLAAEHRRVYLGGSGWSACGRRTGDCSLGRHSGHPPEPLNRCGGGMIAVPAHACRLPPQRSGSQSPGTRSRRPGNPWCAPTLKRASMLSRPPYHPTLPFPPLPFPPLPLPGDVPEHYAGDGLCGVREVQDVGQAAVPGGGHQSQDPVLRRGLQRRPSPRARWVLWEGLGDAWPAQDLACPLPLQPQGVFARACRTSMRPMGQPSHSLSLQIIPPRPAAGEERGHRTREPSGEAEQLGGNRAHAERAAGGRQRGAPPGPGSHPGRGAARPRAAAAHRGGMMTARGVVRGLELQAPSILPQLGTSCIVVPMCKDACSRWNIHTAPWS